MTFLVAAASALTGCTTDVLKRGNNSPDRTQRPVAFYGSGKVAQAAPVTSRERLLDPWLRGKPRTVRTGDRLGDASTYGMMASPTTSRTAFDDPGFEPVIPTQVAAAEPTETDDGVGRYHRVQEGESLASIARRYGVSTSDLRTANRFTEADRLTIGTVVLVPDHLTRGSVPRATATPVAEAASRGRFHVVARGDTLSSIGRTYGVSVGQLERWNPQEVRRGLPVGATLYVPSAVERATPPRPKVPELATAAPVVRPAAKPTATNRFAWPVQGAILSGFGPRGSRIHTGLDIDAQRGTPIRASAAGKVIFAGQMRGYGNVIILDHLDGYYTVYGHNEKNLVARGAPTKPTRIARGQVIAKVGSTGNATTPHVHFEIRRYNNSLDPLALLPRAASTPAIASRKPKVASRAD